MKKRDLLEEIEKLKKRVEELEARPVITVTPTPQPIAVPPWPGYPQPYIGDPWYPPVPTITWQTRITI